MTMSILELLQHIVNEPAPRLTPEGQFPPDSEEFVDACLLKDPDARATPKELLVSFCKLLLKARAHSMQGRQWMLYIKNKDVDLVGWAATF